MKLTFPKTSIDKEAKVFVTFYHHNKRYRLYNGDRIGLELKPNSFPANERFQMGKLLAAEVYKYLQSGNTLTKKGNTNAKTDIEIIENALELKRKSNLSNKYIDTLELIFRKLKELSLNGNISTQIVYQFLDSYPNNTSYNTIRTHLNALLNEAVELGLKENPAKDIKRKRQEAKLHKPFQDILLVLNDIKDFHSHLYLCCLLTYGCLLRPHREIRELKWSDFSPELDYINLSGARNKSKKNRIVPVPEFIKNELSPTLLNHNIFSGDTKPFNPSYFKTLWGRYKRQSTILEDNQTLYSFRHAGAIDIFKRTGSLHKLQTAMGHSSLIVTTTYLRGLEICELTKEDMPGLST